MNKFVLILFLLFIFVSSSYGYVDMSDQFNRAKDLNMREDDYTNSMAILGILNSTLLGLFLWKTL